MSNSNHHIQRIDGQCRHQPSISLKSRRRPRRRPSNEYDSSSSFDSLTSNSSREQSPHRQAQVSSNHTNHSHCSSRKNQRVNRYKNNKRLLKQQQQQQAEHPQVLLPMESEFVALDCEMVGIGPEGHTSVVARVTLIDWDGLILLDEYIVPTEEVTDYRTFVSGITAEDLSQARLTLAECRMILLSLIHDKILVGHALKNDLRALSICHPWHLIRDTAKYEPFMQVRFDDGILWPRKLKDLAEEQLQLTIQHADKPHSPFEDAWAALALYKSVRVKWERIICYKIQKTKEIQQQQEKREEQKLVVDVVAPIVQLPTLVAQ